MYNYSIFSLMKGPRSGGDMGEEEAIEVFVSRPGLSTPFPPVLGVSRKMNTSLHSNTGMQLLTCLSLLSRSLSISAVSDQKIFY